MSICTVRVYHSEESPLSAAIREEIAAAIVKFANYKTVVLKLRHESRKFCGFSILDSRFSILDSLAGMSEDRQRLDEVERTHGSSNGKLIAALGPSKRNFDSDGFYCLTYYPQVRVVQASET